MAYDNGRRRSRRGAMHIGTYNLSISYWVLAGYIVLVFLTGGGSRSDVASLIVLRPVAVLVSAWAFLQIDGATFKRWRGLLAIAAALFILPSLHLVPLPASIWQSLPGRDLVTTISKATELQASFRPLSMSPIDTVNALYSLFVPLAALLLCINLIERERRLILPVILGVGALAIVLGGLQALSPGSPTLHFYESDRMNAASGLFANRNHQALFLAVLLPMLSVFAATKSFSSIQRQLIIGTGLVILLPLLLVTGSRAGLILGLVALVSVLALMPSEASIRERKGLRAWLRDPRLLIGAAGILCAFVIAVSQRAEAFKRLFATSVVEESRFQIWQPALRATAELMPFGSGIGSFVRTYQVYETDDLLTSTYRNHAHNDFIEIAMTGGLPALFMLLVVVIAWARLSWKWMRLPPRSSEVLYGRLGAVLLLIFAIGSAVDYPVRVPSLACLLVIGAIWLRGSGPANSAPSNNVLDNGLIAGSHTAS
jgi:O-antigen ligase